MYWLLIPNKYKSTDDIKQDLGFAAAIILLFIGAVVAVRSSYYYSAGYLIITLICLIIIGILLKITYDYDDALSNMFLRREQQWNRTFSSWQEIRDFERQQESLRKEQQILEDKKRKEEERVQDDKNAWGDMYDKKLEIDLILQSLADEHLHLFDGMPPIKAYLINKPIHDEIHPKGSLAYAKDKEVFFKYDYYKDADLESLIHTMKHEMTHNWIYWKGIKMDDPHGQEFQDKLNSIL